MTDNAILLGYAGEEHIYLDPKRANRHALIAGATGTGKTVTLQMLAEGFSQIGVPVFMADVKGDLSGASQAGATHPKITERFDKLGLAQEGWYAHPCIFWDVLGKQGHPIRATISDMGPLLLSRLLDLNDTQEGILTIAFSLADDEGMLLLDLKDLRAMLNHIADNAKELRSMYGNISSASVGAIQRRLLVLERAGAKQFFGEPMLELDDLLRTDRKGRGYINILAANKLIQNTKVYSIFLLWLLAELFENLPEVGDPDKPVLVFFFDEAHLLFNDAPKALLEKIEQVVRLIRSKGVGVFFVTQSPSDIPDSVLAQLGNRVQHALRAYTPREQKAVKVAAETFRPNPEFDCYEALTQLGGGEALVSTLEKKGVPGIVQRTLIRPPSSRLGPLKDDERAEIMKLSPVAGQYDETVDRESASEMLAEKAKKTAEVAERERLREEEEEREETGSRWTLPDFGDDDRKSRKSTSRKKTTKRRSNRQTVSEAAMKSLARSVSTQLGRALVRGILGGLKKALD